MNSPNQRNNRNECEHGLTKYKILLSNGLLCTNAWLLLGIKDRTEWMQQIGPIAQNEGVSNQSYK